MSTSHFTHLDDSGQARMVDVSAKQPTRRRAVAKARVRMSGETAAAVAEGAFEKGDVIAVARVAGIMAAKRTPELIPLCHPVALSRVTVDFRIDADHIEVEAAAETVDRTGVEMEALTACAAAALTIYDMCKSQDRSMVISDLCLWEKSGGRSGEYSRSEPEQRQSP